MKREQVLEAAAAIKMLDDVKVLRATIAGGKHELRLYALTEKETIEDEVAVEDDALAKKLLGQIVADLEKLLSDAGVTR